MKKLITILAIIMSCFIITSCDEKEEKIKSTSNSQSIWAGVYSFTKYDDDGNALYKAQLTVTKLTDEEFLKSGPNGVVEDDSKSENNEKIKYELKLMYRDGKVGARYVSDKNFYIAHAFNMAYELQPIPEMLAIVSESEGFSKYEGIYVHEY